MARSEGGVGEVKVGDPIMNLFVLDRKEDRRSSNLHRGCRLLGKPSKRRRADFQRCSAAIKDYSREPVSSRHAVRAASASSTSLGIKMVRCFVFAQSTIMATAYQPLRHYGLSGVELGVLF